MIFSKFKTRKPILFSENESSVLHTPPSGSSQLIQLLFWLTQGQLMKNEKILAAYVPPLNTEKQQRSQEKSSENVLAK